MNQTLKKLLVSALALSLCICAGSASAQGQNQPATHFRQLQVPPLNSIEVQKPERTVLENGLTLYLMENHELPLIDAQLLVYTGSRWEPISKAGLASIVGEVIRSGGSERFPGDALDDELDNCATSIEVGIGQNQGSASISSLAENFPRALEILSDLIRQPVFPQEKIDLCKKEMSGSILRRNDDASSICAREFSRLLKGKDSPYGHQVELATLEAISREDLVGFHAEYFQPQNMILGIWGDFKSAEMKELVQKQFGTLTKGTAPRPAIPAVDEEAMAASGVFLIEKTDVEQSFIRLGHSGGKQSDPDYYALVIMDDILGGGFSSRLFCSVRSDKGLAYSVGSSWGAGMDVPGIFLASGSTQLATTVQFINAVKEEIERICREEVTLEELDRSKKTYLNGFVFSFDSTGKIISRLMAYDYYGYPADTLEHFQEKIAQVTQADVLAAARKHLKPDHLAIMVVGNPEKFDQPLSVLGQVKTLDITIPGAE
jgi:zinc protease